MGEMTTEQIQEELRRGIEFYKELDDQILAFLGRLSEVLEDQHELTRLKKPFAKSLRHSSVVQTYLLLLKPTGAEVESDESDDEGDSEEEEEQVDTRDLSFAQDSKLPYVIVQMMGKVPAGATGNATAPFVQYGTMSVTGRKDGKELDNPITMRAGYYSTVFRNRMCNPRSKPPYNHIARKGGVKLVFEERPSNVQPLGSIQSEADIERLAKKVADLVNG
jgi:hypothetical protein